MVYRIYHENQETFSYAMESLDGDLNKVGPKDPEPDEGVAIGRKSRKSGRAIDGTHLPTRMRLDGPKRVVTDVCSAQGFFVDGKFRAAVERLEPGVHQFFPIEFVWKDGTHAAHRFWFIVCNRLDSVDRHRTTKVFDAIWDPYSDGEFVFSPAQIGTCHVWIDRFMPSNMGILITGALKHELDSAGISGLGFNALEAAA